VEVNLSLPSTADKKSEANKTETVSSTVDKKSETNNTDTKEVLNEVNAPASTISTEVNETNGPLPSDETLSVNLSDEKTEALLETASCDSN